MGTSEEAGFSGTDDEAQSAREALVLAIAEQIQHRGYFRAHLAPQPAQAMIDLRWAAQMAGRDVGRQVRTYASSVGANRPDLVTLVVVPTEARTAAELVLRDRSRALVEDLLTGETRFLSRRPLSA